VSPAKNPRLELPGSTEEVVLCLLEVTRVDEVAPWPVPAMTSIHVNLSDTLKEGGGGRAMEFAVTACAGFLVSRKDSRYRLFNAHWGAGSHVRSFLALRAVVGIQSAHRA